MEKYSLKQWRIIKGYNQEELANKVGVSSVSISNYERNGLGSASVAIMDKILNVLDVKFEQININFTK